MALLDKLQAAIADRKEINKTMISRVNDVAKEYELNVTYEQGELHLYEQGASRPIASLLQGYSSILLEY